MSAVPEVKPITLVTKRESALRNMPMFRMPEKARTMPPNTRVPRLNRHS